MENDIEINQQIDDKRKTQLFYFAAIVLVAVINLLFVFVHECWRDEAQAWLIARDNTLLSLFNITSYEGHPLLWYVILMPFARLGFPYFVLKCISYSIMLFVSGIIIIKAPMKKWIRALFVFSPACLYCYVTPARNYCLCALFVVLLAWEYKARYETPIIYGILLALMLQTHIIMAGFVVALCIEWAVNLMIVFYQRKWGKKLLFSNFAGIILPFLSGLLLLFEFRNTIINKSQTVTFGWLAAFALELMKDSYVLLRIMSIPAFFLLITLLIFSFITKKKVIVPFLIATSSIAWQVWIYAFVYGQGNYRLNTWVYLLLWFIWIISDSTDKECEKPTTSITKLVFLLSYVTNVGLWSVTMLTMDLDIRTKYSAAQDTAMIIEELPYDAIIFENSEDYCNAVIPYLKTKKIYNPFSKTVASYIDRNPKLLHSMNYKDFISACKEMFPNVNGIYILMSKSSNCIDGLNEQLANLPKYYTTHYEPIRYDEAFDIYYLPIGG